MNYWFEVMTEEERQIILRAKDGWIIRNLLQFGNALIPNKTIEQQGVKAIKQRLEIFVGSIDIEKTSPSGLGETYIAWLKTKKRS